MTDFNVDPDIEQTTDSTSFGMDGLYANDERAQDLGKALHSLSGDTSDDVDPRNLNRDPTLSELRWYYRRTLGGTLVEKPILDAFKNGLEFVGDSSDEARNLIEGVRFKRDGDYLDALQSAHIKARRDGFALIFVGTADDSGGVHISPISEDVAVRDISHVKVLTIDDLTAAATGSTHEQIQSGTGLDEDDYTIRQTGIVVNNDISSPMFEQPIGYVLDTKNGQFIHADRIEHFTWNPNVDHDYEGSGVRRVENRNTTLGQWEGDSVLVASYNLIKGLSKGNWSIMQAIYRNAASMYSVKLPNDASEEDMTHTVRETRNINAKSSLIFPSVDYEVDQHESGGGLEPQQYFDVIFNQICAVHEMTKSVLFGTQAGTVSGSEVDIKNYFNKVERMRQQRLGSDIESFLTRAKRMADGRTDPSFEFEIDIDWGPLFKVDNQTRIQMMQTAAQATTTLIGNYALTPDEARKILSAEFTQIDLDNLSESQMDTLDRIVLAGMGQAQGQAQNEREMGKRNSREGGQEGGRPEGAKQKSSSTSPTDSVEKLDALVEEGHITEDEYESMKETIMRGE